MQKLQERVQAQEKHCEVLFTCLQGQLQQEHQNQKHMNTETFERKLIHFDEAEYRRQVADFETNRNILNKITDFYEDLFVSKITLQRMGEIFEGNYQALREAIHLAINKSERNRMLADVSIQLFETRFHEFELEAARLVERFRKTSERTVFSTVTPLDWFSLQSGRFIIPSETLELIKERCCNYVATPDEQELFERLQKLSDLINELYDSMGENARDQLGNNFLPRHYNICEFLTADEEGKTIPDPQTNFNFLAQ